MEHFRILLLFSLASFLTAMPLFSQSASPNQRPELDHTTVHVRDLQKSAEFYDKVIGLERIPDPFKDGRHIKPKYKCERVLADDEPVQGLLGSTTGS